LRPAIRENGNPQDRDRTACQFAVSCATLGGLQCHLIAYASLHGETGRACGSFHVSRKLRLRWRVSLADFAFREQYSRFSETNRKETRNLT
jgi:hypothetical protein